MNTDAPAAGETRLPPRLWWCNADFDLTLAHGGGKMPAKIMEAAGAMTWPLWPALAPDDSLLVPVAPPADFRAYLQGLGLRAPHFVTEAAARPVPALAGSARIPVDQAATSEGTGSSASGQTAALRFTPFGWNATAARNAGRPVPSPHPPVDVVKRVNSRAFSLELERALCGEDACPASYCGSGKDVRAWLATAPAGRYVAKGNHGLAGIGQFRFGLGQASGGEPSAAGSGFSASSAGPSLPATLGRLAARQGGVVIEPELPVLREWGVLFRLGRDGRWSALRRHRLLSGPTGGYAGALVLPAEEAEREDAWKTHRGEALRVVEGVAEALRTAGYFGPVGLDMFTFLHGGETRLRALVDLNARLSMAAPAHGLAARFPDRAVLFRQIPATSICLPFDYRELSAVCDKLSFNEAARRGAICLTPLLPLARVSWALVGSDEADALALQDSLFRRLSPVDPKHQQGRQREA